MRTAPAGNNLISGGLLIQIALFTVCFVLAVASSSISDDNPKRLQKVLAIGHRGAAGLAPENTLSAFRRACASGVDGVELDVLLTADGQLVVHHDYALKPDLARTAEGRWIGKAEALIIKNLTLADLRQYDVGRLKPGSRSARRYPAQQAVDGERIPTLDDVIDLIKNKCGHHCQLWIEIKTSPEKPDFTPSPEDVAEAVISLVRDQKVALQTYILSFDWRALKHVQKTAPEIPTVYLSLEGRKLNNIKPGRQGASPWLAGLDIDDFQGSIPRAVAAAGGRNWAGYYKHLTYKDINTAHRIGLQVYAWTVDSKSEMLRLMEMGVDGIITNRPDTLRSVLKMND